MENLSCVLELWMKCWSKHDSDNNQQSADSGPQVVQYGHILATEILWYDSIQGYSIHPETRRRSNGWFKKNIDFSFQPPCFFFQIHIIVDLFILNFSSNLFFTFVFSSLVFHIFYIRIVCFPASLPLRFHHKSGFRIQLHIPWSHILCKRSSNKIIPSTPNLTYLTYTPLYTYG